MWKCDKDSAKLQLVQYLADPRDGYYNATLSVLFSDGVNTDIRYWPNDAMGTDDGVKALTVLTAWMVKNNYGFCPLIEFECNSGQYNIYPYVKKNYIHNVVRMELKPDELPGCVAQAIDIIWNQLQQAYGTDDYLDI